MMSSVGVIFIILIVIFVDLRNSIEASRHVIKIIMNSKEKIIEGKLKLLRHFKHFLTENEEVYFFTEDSNTALRKNKQLGTLVDQ
jgi:cell shape-determining protein MreC